MKTKFAIILAALTATVAATNAGAAELKVLTTGAFKQVVVALVPFILVVGNKESQTDSVSVRVRGAGDQGSTTVADFLARATKLVAEHAMEL